MRAGLMKNNTNCTHHVYCSNDHSSWIYLVSESIKIFETQYIECHIAKKLQARQYLQNCL